MPDVQRNGQSITTTSATTAPSAGTSETWTVTALASGIRTLTSGETYALVDATTGATSSQQAEIVRVTAATAGATSITVTRGVNGTTPVAHANPSTFNIIVTADSLPRRATDWPTWIPYDIANEFEPGKAIYNWKGSNTRVLRRGLAAAAAGGLTNWTVLGDSTTDGSISGVGTLLIDRINAWPLAMRNALAGMGVPVGGTGFIRFADSIMPFTDRVTYAGTWTNNTWNSGSSVVGSTVTVVPDIDGTVLDVWYYSYSGGGTFTVSVNGASSGTGFATISTNGSANWTRTRLTGLNIVGGSTKIVLTVTVAGSSVYLSGCTVLRPNGGLVLHNIAQAGSQAGGTGVASWTDASTAGIGYGLKYVGGQGRLVSDGSFTASSNVFNSATAAFTDNDIGQPLDAPASISVGSVIPENTYIVSRNSSTQVVMSNTAYVTASSYTVQIGRDPSCVFIALGWNDLSNGRTISQIKSDITTIRGWYPNSDCVLLNMQQGSYTLLTQAQQESISTAKYQLADALDVPMIDWAYRLGLFSTAYNNNIYGDGGVHLVPSVQAACGSFMAEVIGESAGKSQAYALPVNDTDLAPKKYVDNKTIAITAANVSVTTTAEIVVLQVKIPANTLKVGSAFDFSWFGHPAATSIITTRVRIGTAGTSSDAAVQVIAATAATNAGSRYVQGVGSVATIGTSATFIAGGAEAVGAISAAGVSTAATSTFDSTKDNFISVTVQNTSSTTTTIYAGRMEFNY